MLATVIFIARLALLALWLGCLGSLLGLIPSPYAGPVLIAGALIAIVHLLEYLFLRQRLAACGSGSGVFVGTMIFGFGYWLPLLRIVEGRRGSGSPGEA